MKNLIKITTICSLLFIACFLISACGDTENFVQGNGKVTVTVKDSSATLLLSNVKIEVHADSATGRIVDTQITDAAGAHDFQLTVGSDYFFTFTDLNTPPRFTSPVNWPAKVTPLLTDTVLLTVALN